MRKAAAAMNVAAVSRSGRTSCIEIPAMASSSLRDGSAPRMRARVAAGRARPISEVSPRLERAAGDPGVPGRAVAIERGPAGRGATSVPTRRGGRGAEGGGPTGEPGGAGPGPPGGARRSR